MSKPNIAKAGKLLSLYKPEGFGAARVLLAGAGDGSAKSVRSAVLAAVRSACLRTDSATTARLLSIS